MKIYYLFESDDFVAIFIWHAYLNACITQCGIMQPPIMKMKMGTPID